MNADKEGVWTGTPFNVVCVCFQDIRSKSPSPGLRPSPLRDVLSDLILSQSRHAASFSNCVAHGAADLPAQPTPPPPRQQWRGCESPDCVMPLNLPPLKA